MKPRDRRKQTGRAESGTHLALPHAVLNSPAFHGLSSHAVRLLCDLGAQYRGFNNGDLCATWSMMAARGWKSRDTLAKALRELVETGMIEQTRQGGKNLCSLYALTWKSIDECKGKLDVSPTRVASNLWRQFAEKKAPARHACQRATPSVLVEKGNPEDKHAERASQAVLREPTDTPAVHLNNLPSSASC